MPIDIRRFYDRGLLRDLNLFHISLSLLNHFFISLFFCSFLFVSLSLWFSLWGKDDFPLAAINLYVSIYGGNCKPPTCLTSIETCVPRKADHGS